MAFKEMEWEFSNVEEKPQTPLQPGIQYLKITGANFDKESDRYKVSVQSLNEDEGTGTLTYFLSKMGSTPGSFDNAQQVGTVISLGIALSGRRIGLPRPDTIVGGVVMAEVTYGKPNEKGISYPNIFKFEPVDSGLKIFSDIDQFYTDEATE